MEMKMICASSLSLFIPNGLTQSFRSSNNARITQCSDCICDNFHFEELERNRGRPSSRTIDSVSPELLISKERDDSSRAPVAKSSCGRSCSAMVHDSRDSVMREEPFVRDIGLESALGVWIGSTLTSHDEDMFGNLAISA